jgi:hypothetical protein
VEKGNGHCCINKYSRNTEEVIIENPKLSLGPSHNTNFQEWKQKKKKTCRQREFVMLPPLRWQCALDYPNTDRVLDVERNRMLIQ